MQNVLRKFLACPRKYLTLLGGLIAFLTIGSSGVISTTSPYYMSYMHIRLGSDQARLPDTIYALNCHQLTNSLTSILAGILINKFDISIRKLYCTGSFIISASYFLTFLTIRKSFFMFLTSYSLLYGVGLGMVFIVPFSIILKWFPESKGKSSAFIMVGYGIGSFIFPEFATYFINPDNLKPDKPFSDRYPEEMYYTNDALLDRVPFFYLMMGGISFVSLVLGHFLMFDAIEADVAVLKINENSEAAIDTSDDEHLYPKLTLKKALKDRNLHVLGLMLSFSTVSYHIFSVNYKNYGQTFIFDDKFLTLIYTVSTAVNIPSRMLWGYFIDKLPFKESFSIMIGGSMFILFTVCFNEYVGNRWTYFLYIALIDFFYSGFSIIHPKVYLRCYGHKNIVLVHGACKLLEIPAILLQSGMTPWLVENFSYFSLFSVVNTFSLISWLLLLVFRAKDPNNAEI